MNNEYYQIGLAALFIYGAIQSVRLWYHKKDSNYYVDQLNDSNFKNGTLRSELNHYKASNNLLNKKLHKAHQDIKAVELDLLHAVNDNNSMAFSNMSLRKELRAYEDTKLLMKSSPVVIHTESVPLMAVQLELSEYEAMTYSESRINGLIADRIAESLSQFLKPIVYHNSTERQTKVEAKFYFKQIDL